MRRLRGLIVVGVVGAGAAFAALPAGAGASVVTHGARIGAHGGEHNLGWSSSNWSGYAITGSGYNSITGAWNVPSVSRTTKATYSSSWIGIDGFNNSNLIQTGTESDWYSGSAHYYAWWEILPAAETRISMSVSPGDHMTASITHGSGSTWTITISDTSNGGHFTINQSYSGPQTSAEWIQEAPSIGGRVAKVAHFSLTTFDPGTVNGGSPHLVAADGGALVQGGSQVATPSNPDSDGDGFAVAYGATAPSPPSS